MYEYRQGSQIILPVCLKCLVFFLSGTLLKIDLWISDRQLYKVRSTTALRTRLKLKFEVLAILLLLLYIKVNHLIQG